MVGCVTSLVILTIYAVSCVCVCVKPVFVARQLDCGIHPGLEGMDALPYIDLIDPAEIDLLLISQ